MAKTPKKKLIEGEVADIDYVALLKSSITSKFGDVIGGFDRIAKREIIPTTLSLDVALGGGICSGGTTILFGPEKCGKTVLALTIARNAQRPTQTYPNGRPVFYINVEARIKERDPTGIHGWDWTRAMLVQSEQGNILGAEKFLQIAHDIIKTVPGAVIIVDSFSQLCTETELTEELSKQQRGELNRLQSKFFRSVCGTIPVNDIVLIGICHQYANVTGYGAGAIMKGGAAVKYGNDSNIGCKFAQPWKTGSGENETQVGQTVNWKVLNSAFEGSPGSEACSYLRYGYGYCRETEITILGETIGLIDKAGTWFNLPDGTKLQGIEKFVHYLRENPTVADELELEIRRTLIPSSNPKSEESVIEPNPSPQQETSV